MAKDREIQCIHYICEGNCDLGKEGNFYGKCQTCKTYLRKPGAKAARTDTRRRKIDKIYKNEKDW